MVLCDAIHRDESTGKFTLLGTFGRINGDESPIPARFGIYFTLTDGLGEMQIWLKIVDAASDVSDTEGVEIIKAGPIDIKMDDPLAIVEGVFGVQMQFPKPGVYFCEILAGEVTLMSRRIVVNGKPIEGEQS